MSVLSSLDKVVNGNRFLLGDQLTAADVVLWGSVFPVFTNKGDFEGLEKCSDLTKWYDNISSNQAFADAAIKVVGQNKLTDLKVGMKVLFDLIFMLH